MRRANKHVESQSVTVFYTFVFCISDDNRLVEELIRHIRLSAFVGRFLHNITNESARFLIDYDEFQRLPSYLIYFSVINEKFRYLVKLHDGSDDLEWILVCLLESILKFICIT